MKKLITIATFIFCANIMFAQFGVNAGYRTNGENNWEKFFEGQDFVKSGYKVGIDYWFRLKNKRIEFTPELAFSQFKSDNIIPNTLPPSSTISAKSQIYSLYLNTNVFFLDLENDCNCPTWSKSNDFIKKGLFLQISPGLNYFQNDIKNYQGSEKVSDFVFSLGAGLGLDIGVSNMLTITPEVSYHYYFNAIWDGLAELDRSNIDDITGKESTDLKQFYAGLRIGIRLDQQNYGFR